LQQDRILAGQRHVGQTNVVPKLLCVTPKWRSCTSSGETARELIPQQSSKTDLI
jgi:hypothetical protein